MRRTLFLLLLPLLSPAGSVGQSVSFAAGREVVAPGGSTAIRITVSGFASVTTVQFTLEWDEEVLRYQSTRNYGLPGLASGNFGTANVQSGRLGFSWDDPNASGISLADGSMLFSVAFDAIGVPGSSTAVSFGDEPTLREVTVDFGAVPFGQQDGRVTIALEGERVLTVDAANVAPGVPIQVIPTDSDGETDGITPFSRRYVSGTEVTLVAPNTFGQRAFANWSVGGVPATLDGRLDLVMTEARSAVAVFGQVATGVDGDDDGTIPRRPVLHPVFPNPLHTTGEIRFELPGPSHVVLAVHDGLGRLVERMVDAFRAEGLHVVSIDPDWPAGTYYFTLRTDETLVVRPMVIVR